MIFLLLLLLMKYSTITSFRRCGSCIRYSTYRSLLSSSGSGSGSALLVSSSTSNQHIVDGHLCNEISITLRNNISIIILEASAESQDKLVDIALESDDIDPYGSVIWPSSIIIAEKLFDLSSSLKDKTILDVGTGTGLVAISALLSGAKKIIAMDYNVFALKLLEKSKTLQGNNIINGRLETIEFDIKNFDKKLPSADIVCFADVLYEKELGVAVAERVAECVKRGSKIMLVSPPHRLGKPYLIDRLKVLFKNENVKNLDGELITIDVAMPVRNSLISDIRGKYNSGGKQDMFILEL